MKKALITGGSGFIAQYLLHTLPDNISVTVTFRNENKWYNSAWADRVPAFPLILNKDIKRQLPAERFDIVIHAAAVSSLAECEKDPGLAEQVNAAASAETSEWCTAKGSRMVYLSTDIVFKGDEAPYKETDKPDPVNVYGRTKMLAENEAGRLAADYAVTRIALAMGRGMGSSQNFIDWFLKRLQSGEEITLFKDEIRTPAAVTFLAKEIWRIALGTEQGIFHLGGLESLNRYELGQKICKKLGRGSGLLKPISLKDMTDYTRPVDVSLVSERSIDNEKINIPPLTDVLDDVLNLPG